MTMKILHCITGLDVGGAETMLYRLATGMDISRFRSRVVSLIEPGPMAKKLTDAGIQVDSLGMTRGTPSPSGLFKLVRLMREWRPDIVQTWLYHADLAGLIAARLAFPLGKGPKVAWNIRCSYMALDEYRKLTGVTLKACSMLSSMPDVVITNSEEARRFHRDLGYAPKRFEVVPNGFELTRFRPDEQTRETVRRELDIPDKALVVGHVARFDAMKDHRTLVAAMGLIAQQCPDAFFLLVGRGVDRTNRDIAQWMDDAGVPSDRVRMPGERQDMERIMTAMDIHVSSSVGESFPSVVGESMACGVPNVVTNVGDSALIVGDTGTVVPARDALALANAVVELVTLPQGDRENLAVKSRKRMEANYSLERIVERMSKMYETL